MDHEGGVVYRYRPRDNEAVNQCWMCDEGRVTYKYINDDRILSPLVRKEGGLERTTWENAWNQVRMLLQNYSPDQRAALLSAQLSNEDLAAWHSLVTTQWTGAAQYGTGKVVESPSEDTLLRRADKNPNSYTTRALGLKPLDLGKCKLLFVVGEASETDLHTIATKKPEVVVVISSNSSTKFEFADVVLPLATFAEQDGTFTNYQGRVQRFHKAIAPRGEAKAAWNIASHISLLEGGKIPDTARDCFDLLAKSVPAYKSLRWDELGDEGKLVD